MQLMAHTNSSMVELIKLRVYEKSDLHFPEKKAAFFERRLRERMDKAGSGSLEDYYARLLESPAEMDALVEHLTTNQTYFYRNSSQFRALSATVIPALVEARGREVVQGWVRGGGTAIGHNPAMSIRVWSAGCSTGEEAYSIAFTLMDAVRYTRAWELEVLATDINREVLDTARRGVYGDDAVKQLDPSVRERYMQRTQDGWSVCGDARSITTFHFANIKDVTAGSSRELVLGGPYGDGLSLDVRGRFDVIFCRNVMIYFDRPGQQRLVDALYDCLRPGGYLFTGDSEPLHLFRHGFVRADDKDALYYKKPE